MLNIIGDLISKAQNNNSFPISQSKSDPTSPLSSSAYNNPRLLIKSLSDAGHLVTVGPGCFYGLEKGKTYQRLTLDGDPVKFGAYVKVDEIPRIGNPYITYLSGKQAGKRVSYVHSGHNEIWMKVDSPPHTTRYRPTPPPPSFDRNFLDRINPDDKVKVIDPSGLTVSNLGNQPVYVYNINDKHAVMIPGSGVVVGNSQAPLQVLTGNDANKEPYLLPDGVQITGKPIFVNSADDLPNPPKPVLLVGKDGQVICGTVSSITKTSDTLLAQIKEGTYLESLSGAGFIALPVSLLQKNTDYKSGADINVVMPDAQYNGTKRTGEVVCIQNGIAYIGQLLDFNRDRVQIRILGPRDNPVFYNLKRGDGPIILRATGSRVLFSPRLVLEPLKTLAVPISTFVDYIYPRPEENLTPNRITHSRNTRRSSASPRSHVSHGAPSEDPILKNLKRGESVTIENNLPDELATELEDALIGQNVTISQALNGGKGSKCLTGILRDINVNSNHLSCNSTIFWFTNGPVTISVEKKS